jgi:hypothetical protein
MADFDIALSALDTKKTSLASMSGKIDQIAENYSTTSLFSPKSAYSTVANRINNNINRLKKGYKNSDTWFGSYLTELQQLESELASKKRSGMTEPISFKGTFEDIFGKITMPCLKTGAESTTIDFGDLEVQSYTWKWYSFTASNGTKIDFYMYIPDFGKNVGKLPVMVYMHGGSSYGNSSSGMTTQGMTKLLNEGKIKPPGIVICPHIRNFEGCNMENCIAELTDYVVENYNGDSNRLSISGHSYGAILSYRVIRANPDKYAACIPISGWSKVDESATSTKFWAFHGSNDNRGGHTSYSGALNTISQLQSMGAEAEMHTFKGAGHGYVQTYTFQEPYTSPDGEEEYAWAWAMKQTRDKKVSNRNLGVKKDT